MTKGLIWQKLVSSCIFKREKYCGSAFDGHISEGKTFCSPHNCPLAEAAKIVHNDLNE